MHANQPSKRFLATWRDAPQPRSGTRAGLDPALPRTRATTDRFAWPIGGRGSSQPRLLPAARGRGCMLLPIRSCDGASFARPGPLPTPPRGSRTRPGHCPVARTRHPLLFPPHGMHTSMRMVGLAGTEWRNSRALSTHGAWVYVCACVRARGLDSERGGRKPVDWTACVGAEACLRHAPHAAGPGTNEVPAANLAMELVRGPP